MLKNTRNTIVLLTLEIERFVPARIQCPALYLRVQPMFFVRQQRHPDVRVGRAAQVHCRQVFSLKHRRRIVVYRRMTGRNTRHRGLGRRKRVWG